MKKLLTVTCLAGLLSIPSVVFADEAVPDEAVPDEVMSDEVMSDEVMSDEAMSDEAIAEEAMLEEPEISPEMQGHIGNSHSGAVWYGSIRAGVTSSGGNATGYDGASRFGVMGSSEIAEGLSAVYQFEHSIDSTSAGLPSGRLSYVGLSGGFGTVTAGKISSATSNIVGFTDQSPYNGDSGATGKHGNAVSYAASSGALSMQIDAIMNGKDDISYEFGVSMNIGDMGKIAFAHRSVADSQITTTTTYSKLQSDVEHLQQALGDLGVLSVTLSGSVPAESHTMTLVQYLKSLREDVDALDSGLTGQTTEVTSLKTSLGSLSTSLTALETALAGKAASSDLTALATTVAGKATSSVLTALATTVNDLATDVQTKLTGITTNRVTDLANNAALTKRVTDLETELDNLSIAWAPGWEATLKVKREFKKIDYDEGNGTYKYTKGTKVTFSGELDKDMPVSIVREYKAKPSTVHHWTVSQLNMVNSPSDDLDDIKSIDDHIYTDFIRLAPLDSSDQEVKVKVRRVITYVDDTIDSDTVYFEKEAEAEAGKLNTDKAITAVRLAEVAAITDKTFQTASYSAPIDIDPPVELTRGESTAAAEHVSLTPVTTPTTVSGEKTNILAAQVALGQVTAHLGWSETKINNGGAKSDAFRAGVTGPIGDTGLSYVAQIVDHDTSSPWIVALTKDLGGGASLVYEHHNPDVGTSSRNTVALHVDF